MKPFWIASAAAVLLLSACGANSASQGHMHGMHHGHYGHQESMDPSTDHHGSHFGAGSDPAMTADNVQAVWRFNDGETPQAGQDAKVQIQIQNNSGMLIDKFDISHEEMLHLIIVSKDLSYFDHIHPEYRGKGYFEITTRFPDGGDYKLVADFVPTGGSAMSKMEWVRVEGEERKPEPLQPETEFSKIVSGKKVELSFNQLAAGKETEIVFHITDAETSAPITDLQPYLGAIGHVVILSDDTEHYLHVHPLDELAQGPDAKFATAFPESGVYKLWGQFKHNDQLFTVPFVIHVP